MCPDTRHRAIGFNVCPVELWTCFFFLFYLAILPFFPFGTILFNLVIPPGYSFEYFLLKGKEIKINVQFCHLQSIYEITVVFDMLPSFSGLQGLMRIKQLMMESPLSFRIYWLEIPPMHLKNSLLNKGFGYFCKKNNYRMICYINWNVVCIMYPFNFQVLS
jgi:hypothetical protein